MKKMLALVLSLLLVLAAASAETVSVPETMAGMEWMFASGVGGWSTELHFQPDGSFTGNYHDSEMGETADAYPNGSLYICSFSGKMSLVEQVDEGTWRLRVDSLVKDEMTETVEDGVRYVPADSYGISEGETFLLHAPGTSADVLSEEMRFWAHINEQETQTELENWFLGSESADQGFVGFPAAGIANPWEDLSAEALAEVSGLSFAVPEGAENVIYRYLRSEGLAEMQFTIGENEFDARIQPATLDEGQLMNISGMYFAWENEEPVTIGNCAGIIGRAQTGSTEWVELCQWYDAARGRMYAVSAYTTQPEGLDLAADAEQILIPAENP